MLVSAALVFAVSSAPAQATPRSDGDRDRYSASTYRIHHHTRHHRHKCGWNKGHRHRGHWHRGHYHKCQPRYYARHKHGSHRNYSNVRYDVWDRLAKCESSGNWKINTGNGYYGGLQFHPGTWKAYGGHKYARNAHQATKRQQIEIAKKVRNARGGYGDWPACAKKLRLHR